MSGEKFLVVYISKVKLITLFLSAYFLYLKIFLKVNIFLI